MTSLTQQFHDTGWVKLTSVPGLADWVSDVAPLAAKIAADPAQRQAWLRHGGTWFAGVNALPNDADGRIGNGLSLTAVFGNLLKDMDLPVQFDPGQISVIYPGYPAKDPTEREAALRFRKTRAAAHVDGLLPVGPDRRRFLREPHAYVLGIPLNHTDPGASPLVVWEGSHHLSVKNFNMRIASEPEKSPDMVDLTDIYHDIRFKIFDTCPRVAVHSRPGEAYLIHRAALHGVAPWAPTATAPPEGRMILYFRPEYDSLEQWLTAP